MSKNIFNPAADLAAANASFAGNSRTLIENFLDPAFASELAGELQLEQDWNLVFRDNNRHYDLHRTQWQALTAETHQQLRQRIVAVGQLGFQYWYYNIPLFDMVAQGHKVGARSQEFYELLQSPEFIRRMRQVTGEDTIEFADCQATKFNNGSFLSRHDDEVAGKNRRAAYVFGLSPQWRADWGGLLTFPDNNASKGEYFLPQFNCLYLFKVPQPHLVSMVSPLATQERVSLTGWLRSGDA